jgi:hypothetical protein
VSTREERLEHLVERRTRVTFRSDVFDTVAAWLALCLLGVAPLVGTAWLFGHTALCIAAGVVWCVGWAVVAWFDVVGDERLIEKELARRAEEDDA